MIERGYNAPRFRGLGLFPLVLGSESCGYAIGTKAAAKRKGQVGQCAASPCPLPGQPRRAENNVPNTG